MDDTRQLRTGNVELWDNLAHGKACVSCRRRRTKCDGVKPFCGQCTRRGWSSDCEYTDIQGHTKFELLEERIRLLRARIHELENPEASSDSVFLHNPYIGHSGSNETGEVHGPVYEASSPSTVPPDAIPPELPELHETLTQAYTTLAARYSGLTSTWFHKLFTSPLRNVVVVVGRNEFPHSAFMNAVFLWTIRFERSGELVKYEAEYYKLCEIGLQESLSELRPTEEGRIGCGHLQIIHAHLLLAQYNFVRDNILRGRYYLSGAATLALACGLHRISASSVARSGSSFPDPDALTYDESIWTFWVIFTLDRCWSFASGSPPTFADRAGTVSEIITPWPVVVGDSVNSALDGTRVVGCSGTVQRFLSGEEIHSEGRSELALLAKASVLLERTRSLRLSCVSASGRDEETARKELQSLMQTIRVFAENIPSLEEILVPEGVMHNRDTYLLIHALIDATMVSICSMNREWTDEDIGSTVYHTERICLVLEAVFSGDDSEIVDPMFRVIGRHVVGNFLHPRRGLSSNALASSGTNDRLTEIGGQISEVLKRHESPGA